MKNDREIAYGRVAPKSYRHPLVSHITSVLDCLKQLPDSAAGRWVKWTPQAVGTAAILMALKHHVTLRAACGDALACLSRDFHGPCRVGRTYNGFVKALERQANQVLPIVKASLRKKVRARLNRARKIAGWLVLAVDGSKEELPRTKDLELEFGIADNGSVPQARVSPVVEVLSGLPWDWRIDRGDASEHDHLMQMAETLPKDALLIADANYCGHALWSQLDRLEQPFLIRVGGNVHLLTDLWPDSRIRVEDQTVYAWPKHAQSKTAPLKLRLIRVGRGAKAVYLLTNVQDSARLSKRSAGEIYRKRWGVEIFFRTLKRTFGFAKIRSKSARRAMLEMEWAMIAMIVSTLIGGDVLTDCGLKAEQLSPALMLETLRASLHREPPRPSDVAHSEFRRNIASCLRDDYQRNRPKRSRVRPHTKNTPTTHNMSPPNLMRPTESERRRARKMIEQMAAA